jgi:hypothetical protein
MTPANALHPVESFAHQINIGRGYSDTGIANREDGFVGFIPYLQVDRSICWRLARLVTHPLMVYFMALPTRLKIIFSYFLSRDPTRTHPMIRINIGISRCKITLYHKFKLGFFDSTAKQCLYVSRRSFITRTARSRVMTPRLTSLNDPFSRPASRRDTSINVETRRVNRRLKSAITSFYALTHSGGP